MRKTFMIGEIIQSSWLNEVIPNDYFWPLLGMTVEIPVEITEENNIVFDNRCFQTEDRFREYFCRYIPAKIKRNKEALVNNSLKVLAYIRCDGNTIKDARNPPAQSCSIYSP